MSGTVQGEKPYGPIRLYTDGACKGNPGPGGAGARAEFPDRSVEEWTKFLGRKTTNNKAEYSAIILGLEGILQKSVEYSRGVIIYTDSNLAVKQINAEWSVKNAEIRVLKEKVMKLLHMNNFPAGWTVKWVKAHAGISGNERADELANEAIMRGLKGI